MKWFDAQKGFGFIAPLTTEPMKDVFVHVTAIQARSKLEKTLSPGDEVEFDIEDVTQGKRAKNVKVLKRAMPQPARPRDYVQRHD